MPRRRSLRRRKPSSTDINAIEKALEQGEPGSTEVVDEIQAETDGEELPSNDEYLAAYAAFLGEAVAVLFGEEVGGNFRRLRCCKRRVQTVVVAPADPVPACGGGGR